MALIIDTRWAECVHAETNAENQRSCRLDLRALLYPAVGCSGCRVFHSTDPGPLKNRNKRHAMRLTDD